MRPVYKTILRIREREKKERQLAFAEAEAERARQEFCGTVAARARKTSVPRALLGGCLEFGGRRQGVRGVALQV